MVAYPIFPLVWVCRNSVKGKQWFAEVQKMFFKIFHGIPVSPRVDSYSGQLPVSEGIQFLGGGSDFRQFWHIDTRRG